jgi:hypothetical protein
VVEPEVTSTVDKLVRANQLGYLRLGIEFLNVESLEAVDQTRRESWCVLIKALAGKEDAAP